MHQNNIFMFSGQGSQNYHMGKQLYENNLMFRYWLDRLDELYRQITGVSLVKEMYNPPNKREVFSNIIMTHPGIFMVEYALARTLIEDGIIPDYVIGTSVGEYAASAIAGCITYEEALYSLIEQSQQLLRLAPKGKMVSVLTHIDVYNQMELLQEITSLVSINFPKNFTIAYLESNGELIENTLKDIGALIYILPVEYAFHSKFIDEIKPSYKCVLDKIQYRKPKIPLLSCVSGQIENQLNTNYLWDVVRQPIQFTKALKNLLNNDDEFAFIDVGPSGTLYNFTKYNLKDTDGISLHMILTPYHKDIENYNNTVDKLYSRRK